MVNIDMPKLEPATKQMETLTLFPSGTWRQSLQISHVGSTEYLDEGNGRFEMKR
jgi:hypothetical protein